MTAEQQEKQKKRNQMTNLLSDTAETTTATANTMATIPNNTTTTNLSPEEVQKRLREIMKKNNEERRLIRESADFIKFEDGETMILLIDYKDPNTCKSLDPKVIKQGEKARKLWRYMVYVLESSIKNKKIDPNAKKRWDVGLKNSERLDYLIDEHLKKSDDTSADLRVKVSRKGREKEDTEYTIDPI